MRKPPHTPAEYDEAVAICRATKQGTEYKNKKTGQHVKVANTVAHGYYPHIGLRSCKPGDTGMGGRYFTTKALSFKRDYETA